MPWQTLDALAISLKHLTRPGVVVSTRFDRLGRSLICGTLCLTCWFSLLAVGRNLGDMISIFLAPLALKWQGAANES